MSFRNVKLILHADLNNFYASVECMLCPQLKNVPMAVSGDPLKRHGIILAKNEIAKKMGVKTAEAIWMAKQKAPGLVLVPPHMDMYIKFSNIVFDIYTRFTPQVEPFGADECWLDISNCPNIIPNFKGTDVFEYGRQVADILRTTVFNETGLTISVGVSYNKIFAKMGSDLKKPNATSVITRDNYKSLLHHLPAGELFMVGEKSAEKLKKLNIFTIGDIAVADSAMLNAHFGKNGESMRINACGLDTEPVREYVKPRLEKSVGHGITATRDITTLEDAKTVIFLLADKIAVRLRKHSRLCGGVSVDMRDSSLNHVSRQKKITPTCAGAEIARTAYELFCANWDKSVALRTITVSTFDLGEGETGQLNMFDSVKNSKQESIEKALDKIHKKYGKESIKRGNLIGKDFIYDKDDDEDFLPFKR